MPPTRGQLAIVRRLFHAADEIIGATDAGREGELILRYILELTGCTGKPARRLWLSSLTREAIRDAFAHLRPLSDYDALFAAARCRSEADWVVGLNATRNYTVRYRSGGILWSVGRVQTLGLDRAQLVSSTPRHYPCTRRWAEVLQGRHVGGQPTHGLLWHSRQRELHHRALDARPALQDLVGEIPAEVAVVWAPPADDRLLEGADGSLGPLAEGAGHAYVQDITALLQIVYV